jgi:hypothetical protein
VACSTAIGSAYYGRIAPPPCAGRPIRAALAGTDILIHLVRLGADIRTLVSLR